MIKSSTAKKIPASPLDVFKEKAPLDFSTSVSFQRFLIDEGYAFGEDQILQQFHAFMDILWESNNSTVCYVFPGHAAHNLHFVPYSQHHILDKKKKLKKIATKAELQSYCNRCNPNKGKSTWMNL